MAITLQAAVTSLIWFCATIPWLLLCAATYRGALRTWALKTAVFVIIHMISIHNVFIVALFMSISVDKKVYSVKKSG